MQNRSKCGLGPAFSLVLARFCIQIALTPLQRPKAHDQTPSAENDLLFDLKDGIGRVTFNRPQARNAFTFAMYERLAAICEQANTDKSIKVLVFQGAGDKA